MSATTELHDNTKTLNHVEEPKEKIELLNELSEPTHEELEVRRRQRLAKWSQVITLIFVVLELAIAFRVLLELIAANPARPVRPLRVSDDRAIPGAVCRLDGDAVSRWLRVGNSGADRDGSLWGVVLADHPCDVGDL